MTRFIRCALAVCFLLSMAGLAFSQSRNTGEIRGTVTASGAVVPSATVTLTNIDTGETKDFVTNQDGIYDTVSTPAGNYNISFSAPGFKKLTRGPIAMQIDVITEDASLDVGAVTETVTVEATAPVLETETSKMGAVLDAKTVGVLPQIGAGITGNDWANFNILLPGAAGTASGAGGGEGSGNYNAGDAIEINGNLPNYANYLQDGAVVQLPVSNNVDNLVFEAVQEVQVTTSSFSAEYGIGGAVFNQISKSGSNGFHGSAYEFWQNNILNARPYFQVVKNGVTQAQQAPYLRYDQYGGSIGGPIIKNKLFFYFVRDRIYNFGGSSTKTNTVPTLAERGGDFSAAGLPTIYDPLTTSCSGSPSVCTRTPFSGNIIPANRIDPVAAKILGFYPTPNGAVGALTGNFNFSGAAPNPNLRYFGRIDYDISQKNRLSFSISQKDNPGQNINALPCPLNCYSGDIDGYNAQVTLTSEISPTMVNDLRMSYTKQGNWFVPKTLGFNAASTLGLQYAKANIFPNVNISGAGGCCLGLAAGTNAIYIEGLYDPSDVMTLIHGRHILHFGVEVLMGDGDTTPWGNVNAGTFGFTGAYTSNNGAANTGAGLADFLLGDVQNWSATNQKTSYMRLKSPQFFAQDDFKVRPNLTVNLGLRYVATTGMSEIHNSLGGFDPNIVNPTDGSLGYMWFAGQENRNTLQKPSYAIFLPRVGFAWSVKNDTVVRGGFGMYSYNYSEDTYGNGVGAGALTTSTGNANDLAPLTAVNPLVSLSATAAQAAPVLNYVVGSPNAHNPGTYYTPGQYHNETFVPYNVPVARINEWQLSVEHQFGHSYMASIAYVGSKAMNLQYPTDINQITNPTVLANIAAGAPGYTTKANIQSFRPFPDWGNLTGDNYNGITHYNALQGTFNKHFSSGLLFSVNYVWSHFLDSQDSSGWGSRAGTQDWQIGNNPAANYGNSNFDIPNAFKGYVSYELPFGKGKSYLASNGVEDAVVGGWRISGTFIAQSGTPFTVINGGSNNSESQCSGCQWYPNVVGDPHAAPALSGAFLAANPGAISYFNPLAYAIPANGTFGDEVRNSLRGPGLKVVDLSLAKNVHFGERISLELRGDFVNALNHPSFGNPGLTVTGGNFGVIDNATNSIAVAPRSGQLSARISF
ncbi:MAG TPA: TonB-dependent receptor [Terriglobales bacterium]|nr:TonB-dependent receptor [Terriglobales bacterium]